MRFSRPALFISIIFLISCGAQQNRTPAVGQAYVGPTTLLLHQDLNPKSPGTATVRHGERLDIVEYKRRFVKVRTAGGIEGWTDTRQLLSPEQMSDLQRVAQQTARFPSQGTATTSELVNVHTEPSRTSPGFLQIPEGGKVEVIGHKVTPRTQLAAAIPPPPPKPRNSRRKSKERSSSTKIPPPPMPPAPRLPAHWQDLSKTRLPDLARDGASSKTAAPPVPTEDWNLVRSADGKVGWVLSRMLNMAIPDEVAQYAEGRRITSYFAMGNVQDESQVKHNWLWTTVRKPSMPYEFDNFRFFIWSRRHHRYETVYIERDVIGHFPVEVDASGPNPTFTMILEDDSGNFWRKKYVFNGYRVNRVDTSPFAAPQKEAVSPPALAVNKNAGSPSQSWYSSMKQKVVNLFHR
ncbi:MAG: hypothetical protein M3Y27_10710 [Acidobacteriota bacterium]|nr:hypothetical protein [Acidobacteriota bacterium]